jgi:hypothetical protein
MSEPITEDWLKSVGFKWSQFERQPSKHWTLWLGACLECDFRRGGSDSEELGIELADGRDGAWFCWLRSDTAGRYHRFIHIRHLRNQRQLIGIVEAFTGLPWNPANHFYGSVRCDKCAARFRKEEERFDRKLMAESHPWTEQEKDETRSKPLIEHVDAAIKGGLAK